MKNFFASVAVVAGAAVLAASVPTAHAQTTQADPYYQPRVMSRFLYFGTGLHPRTQAMVESYFGTRNIGFRSQRDRQESRQNRFLTDEHYLDNQVFSDAQLRTFDRNLFEVYERIAIENKGRLYDNDSFADAQFDFRALVSNECFDPVRGEIPACIAKHGPFYNLKKAVMDERFKNRIIQFNPDVAADAEVLFEVMQANLAANEKTAADTRTVRTGTSTRTNVRGNTVDHSDIREVRSANGRVTSVVTNKGEVLDLTYNQIVRMNAHFVWEVCSEKYPNSREATSCYVRNQRLVTNPDVGLIIEATAAARTIR